ncbi:MAG: CDP-diacylglycerol--glycerol-3-phosphate 3-phosphatidyltransferase [Phycisphaerales bacterium]|nr:CDP-diacylglycerol--glycerol-3-phosphate 3-phosphatidyltransferase [Phycisphaerales bacterium]
MAAPQVMMQTQQSSKAHIPNLLTLSRVVLAWVFVILLSMVSPRTLSTEPTGIDRLGDISQPGTGLLIAATVVFIIAAITDALDGHLARKWKVESKFGRIMDPMADKLLILGGFVMFATPAFKASIMPNDISIQLTSVAGWMVIAMIMRELLVTSIRGVYESEGVDFSAGSIGKAKMILQSITIPIVLLIIAFGSPTPDSTGRLVIVMLVWATVVTTLISGLPYIGQALKHTMDQQARMLEVMRGKKARKSTKVSGPSGKSRPKTNKGGQSVKTR